MGILLRGRCEGVVLLNPAGLGLLLEGTVSWAAVRRLADLFEWRAVCLGVYVARGTEEKAMEEVGQYGEQKSF